MYIARLSFRITANNFGLPRILPAMVRGELCGALFNLVKPNLGNLNVGSMGTAISDDTDGFQ